MTFDLVEPVLNSVYLFLGISGFLGSFIGWLYHLQREKRKEDKKELYDYVDSKFSLVCEHIQTTNKNTNEKLDHSLDLLKKILIYETRNIKLHIRNLSITDDRLENDISRIEGIILFKKTPDPGDYYRIKGNTKDNKKSNIPYSSDQDIGMEDNGNEL